MAIDFAPSLKQDQLFKAWDDEETTQVLYGGAAGGGKSYGLCALFVLKALKFPGTRYLLGREELINLKRTTLKTLYKVFKDFKLVSGTHYNYNQTSGEILFFNGSMILLMHLKYEPSDPDCDFLGGLELTAAGIDEMPEVAEKVVTVLHSRCGRWLNEKYKIKPMLYGTCNPSRGFVFDKFYKPFTKGMLAYFRKFIPATIIDNAHLTEAYAKHLETTLSGNDKRRLLQGKWEFDSDPNSLVKFSNINGAYDYDKPAEFRGTKYLTCDIAFTSDKCIIILWSGFDVIKIRVVIKDKEKPEEVIKKMKAEHKIKNANVAYDATGAGMYLKNYLPGAYVFHSGAKPIGRKKQVKEFEHLKTQCYYLLAMEIMKEDSAFRIFDDNLKEELVDEVLQIKTLPKEKMDGVVKMIKKDEIKKLIGRSPDILDALAMRFVWTVKTVYKRNF